MKKITQIIFLAAAALAVFFASCSKKGDVGPAGPQGSQGATGETDIIADGYIKGNISGTRQDGNAFTETFTYTACYNPQQSSIDSISPTSYDFNIRRAPINQLFTEFDAELQFNASSLSPVNVTSANFKVSLSKLTGTTEFLFGTNSSGITPVVSGVIYDKTTGVITGNYIVNLTGAQNSTGNAANITGSFKATIAQIYYRAIKNNQQVNFTR